MKPGKLGEKILNGYQKVEDRFITTFLDEDGSLKTGGMAEKVTAEMCIRDRSSTVRSVNSRLASMPGRLGRTGRAPGESSSLSYVSSNTAPVARSVSYTHLFKFVVKYTAADKHMKITVFYPIQ